jgi:hypothetical protein
MVMILGFPRAGRGGVGGSKEGGHASTGICSSCSSLAGVKAIGSVWLFRLVTGRQKQAAFIIVKVNTNVERRRRSGSKGRSPANALS